MGTRVGLFGGSFNPIHHGHLIVARAVAEALELSKVILVPASGPPHKTAHDLIDARHRTAMVRAAIADDPMFSCDDFDATRPGPCYTIDTVDHFRGVLGADVEICWIIGADSLLDLATWRRVHELVERCRIVTARRADAPLADLSRLRSVFTDAQIDRLRADVLPTPMIETSSTDIRRRISAGRSIRYLTPEAVQAYIAKHGLYRDPA
jgi:nicotinate-nucleotide adenylyltransferase